MTLQAQRSRRILNAFRPQQFFVERERSDSGEIVSVATIFLTNRECPWQCIYCDLWKNTTTESVPLGSIPAQIDFALRALVRDSISQIKLYNAGSFFDPKAIPPEDFPAIAERVCNFDRVIVECHPALVGQSALDFRDLLTNHKTRTTNHFHTRLEVAMGLEVADDAILTRLNKRMTLAMFRHAADFLIGNGIALRAFVIVKPPFVRTNDDAVELAQRSIDFAFECGTTVVSLIPARFGAEQLDELSRFGEFSPPSLDALEDSLDYGVIQKRGRVFADLWDIEKLGGCCRCLPERVARLRQMNLEQRVLPRVECAHEGILCSSRS